MRAQPPIHADGPACPGGLPLCAWTLAALVAGLLTFWNLGHYALWDDEADTALFGESVWRTGDLDCRVGQNIVAIYNGRLIKDFRQRYMPPLQYYVAAPFVGPNPGSALAARLPFAVAGLAAVVLMIAAVRRFSRDRATSLIGLAAILSCVPLFLFSRQCRYFPLVILLTAAILWLYETGARPRIRVALLAVAGWSLIATHYLAFLALVLSLGVDWLLVRKTDAQRLTVRQVLTVGSAILLAGLPIVLWCNPLQRYSDETSVGLGQRIQAIWLFAREANFGNIYYFVTLVTAGLLALLYRDRLLARALLFTVIYTIVLAMSAKGSSSLGVDVTDRYMVGLLPVSILISARVLWRIWAVKPLLGVIAGVVLLFSNLASFEWTDGHLRSHQVEYAIELVAPPEANNTTIADFVRAWIPPRSSIEIRAHHRYPLMFHVPENVYAWQLTPDKRPEFPGLPAIHFIGEQAPDYIVRSDLPDWRMDHIQLNNGTTVSYRWFGVIPTYSVSTYRPSHVGRFYYMSPLLACEGADELIHVYQRADLSAPKPPISDEVKGFLAGHPEAN